ncbi:RluA family pseudouridine synthase [Spirulina subsalsa FACHB-351]|uniref:RNA pseudouridylate synthase n=1 Tax=Spirulina subsalsa FACHB-351 TaxID=234711 RepID=A0ABT3L5E7_9CYAN|nr:RluA family pseudouridine synthase [Spirulina subsalsa]MCW6036727.1 RluA family pseudouridine synthase [Spirulina subsalsa FACHB-351]
MTLNRGWVYRDIVRPEYGGWSVLDYYSQLYRHSSREVWGDRITQGQIRLNDHPTTPHTRLKPGQILTYHRPPWVEPPAPLNFTLLATDPDFLVVVKPSGLPVLPGAGFLEQTLWFQLQQQYPDIAPIHRLGRGTSGVILWARTPQGRQILSRQLRQGEMVKEYRALVPDWTHGDSLTITHPIGKIPHPTLGTVYAATTEGMRAESRVQYLGKQETGVLLGVIIPTGRPHQIRIHLAAVGHPLLGDPLYQPGGGLNLTLNPETATYAVPGDGGYYLHAHRLSFFHPQTGEHLTYEAPPPAWISELRVGNRE